MRARWLSILLVCFAPSLADAQPPPSGPHPRIWLDEATLTTLRAQRDTAGSGIARAFATCADARDNPDEHAMGGTWTFDWGFIVAACGMAYQVGGNTDDADTGIRYLGALLDDYQAFGDGLGGDDVVRHDTGYSIRTFAPYAALGYDWLHDAPAMTDTLRAHARARFKAWTDWYNSAGYLRDIPGANYQAGYTFAATLIAIAEGGEAGADGDALWRTVVDTIFGTTLARGFDLSSPARPADDVNPGGVLVGGDWAEGWQYGPLSVIEYALAARALEEQGVALPSFDRWAGDLTLRSIYATNPSRDGLWVGGDFDDAPRWQAIPRRTLLATVAGTASEDARAWARAELERIGGHDDAIFEALADAHVGEATPFSSGAPLVYFAEGTGTLYARDAWTSDAIWAVIHASPRMVPDHEHPDSGNWALTRGADDVVVDPSPYGTRSTLTSNAPAVDSNLLGVDSEYSPSQTPWNGSTTMSWRRVTTTGIVAVRIDYHDAFRFREIDSDVPVALRDWILVPHGGDASVVLVDRVRTGDASRALHLRIRTPGTLTGSGDVASATVGGSEVVMRRVYSSSGDPVLRHFDAADCAIDFGKCEDPRFPVDQFQLDVDGPDASAIELVDALPSGSPIPDAQLLEGAGYRGVSFARAGTTYSVIGSDAPDGDAGGSLTYVAPAGVHVVVDAPRGDMGRSDVSASASAGGCELTITPASGASAGYDGRPLIVAISDACAVSELGEMPVGVDAGVGGLDGGPGHDGGVHGDAGPNAPSAGCGCVAAGSRARASLAWVLALFVLGARSLRKAPRARASAARRG